jgi:Tfp pilus assembly protein PilF
MNRRHGPLLSALLLGLLASAGCMSWQGCMPQMVIAEHPAGPSGCAGELTPAQAAQLCLTAGEALEKKGFTAEAILQYENARKHNPQVPAVSRHLSVLYDLQGDAARAKTEYLRALQQQPRDVELLNDFGYFHYRHNQPQEAEHWLRSAIAVDPSCACAWINLGQVLARQGRVEESYQAFSHVLRPAEAYSNLGILLAKQGRTAEARQALQRAVKLDPRLAQPRTFLTALADIPGPLPPGLRHTPAPVLRMSATKAAYAVPPPASNLEKRVEALPTNRQPPRIEEMAPNRNLAAPTSARPSGPSSRPTTAPAEFSDLPIIVNGQIQPPPISCRRVSVQASEQSSLAKVSTAPPRDTAPSPPPALPSPPPLALLASASTVEPILIRSSASAVPPVVPRTNPDEPRPSLIPVPDRPKPLSRPSLIPVPDRPRPQAVLTDCQGEHEPENGPQ